MFFLSKFDRIYKKLIAQQNQILKEQTSTTDYTPNELLNQIYDDIKTEGLEDDWCLQYTYDDFMKYVTPKNYSHYKQFKQKFKGNKDNFTLIILNWSFFDNKKLDEGVKKFCPTFNEKVNKKIEKLSEQQAIQLKKQMKENFQKIYEEASNFKVAENLANSCQLQKSKKYIKEILKQFALNEQSFKQPITDKKVSCKNIFKYQLGNYYRYLLTGHKTLKTHDKTGGFCYVNFNEDQNDQGFLFFINKNLNSNLEDLQSVMNHEIDHYFQQVIKGVENHTNTEEDSKIIEKNIDPAKEDIKYIKYLYERSEFQSHSTDLCNFLLNRIIPISGKNALSELLNCIKTRKCPYEWCPKTKAQITTLQFAITTYKLFNSNSKSIWSKLKKKIFDIGEESKWQQLQKRLTTEFQKYQNMDQKQQKEYAQNLKKRYTPFTKEQRLALKKIKLAAKQKMKQESKTM